MTYDPVEQMNRLLAKEYEQVPATQVVKEVDWQNMNEAMVMLGFNMATIEEFCKMSKADVVQGYYEGKLLLFRQTR